jgi:hypothetical protein
VKRLKSGPELKMPDLKVPAFLVDLYWDLRDRHLLPLVGLAIVAIVAVPFLLGGGSERETPPAPGASASALPSPEPTGSKLTVVEAKPGLRDYRKRLRADSPTDPFKQRYTSPQLEGTELGGAGEEAASSSTTSTTTTSSSAKVTKTTKNSSGTTTTEVVTETGGESSPAGKGGSSHGDLTLFSFAVDLKIVRTQTNADGSKQTGDPEIRHRVLPPAPLPSEKEQAVTYMGISPKTQQPLLLISDAVTSIFGEATCLSGAETCQLIEVAPGLPMTFVYGPASVRYKITVLKTFPVVAGQASPSPE